MCMCMLTLEGTSSYFYGLGGHRLYVWGGRGGRGDGGVWALAEGRSSAGGGVTTEERDKKKGKHNREVSKGMQGYRGYEWLATALRSLTAKGPGNGRGEQEELGRQQQSGISSNLCLLGEAPALTFC